jgi:hypothetical protein
MSSLLKQKKYPSQYPKDAVKVLNAMSFSKGASIKIVGSQALQSQQYAGDYDAYEVVSVKGEKATALNELAKGFQSIIKELKSMSNVYIGDIKSGIIEEWKVLGVRKPTTKVESLLKANIISEREAQHALTLLKGSKLKAKQELKFHIIRWSPEEVLKGSKTLRDGRTYTLQEAFSSPTITKLDVVALVDKRYTEFSIIYEFHNGSQTLNPDDIDPEKSLKESIKIYQEEGNPFKVIKRKFSLAKLKNNKSDLKKFSAILNSETGKLYTLYSDVKTLADLMEDHTLPEQSLRQAFNNFSERLRAIYAQDIHLKDKKDLLLQLRSTKNLRAIEKELYNHLKQATELRGGYYPIDQE